MNHLEAQSYIMPFIEGKIPDDKQGDFVLHMKTCKKCHEELEVYYTLLVGMKQLDNNERLSSDFNKSLERDLNQMGHKVRNRRSIRVSAFSIVTMVLVAFIGTFYFSSLTSVYHYEQYMKKVYQGDRYFSNRLGDALDINRFVNGNDLVYRYFETDIKKEASDKEKLKDYKYIRGYIDMKETLTKMNHLGDQVREDIITRENVDDTKE